jgi:serine/threonine-protein kinase
MTVKCPKCQSINPDTQKFCGECATPLQSTDEIAASQTKTLQIPVKDLMKGSTFAERYQIIEELGRGGMGVVYKAEDTNLKRRVALKFLPPELTHVPDVKERFMREAQAAAALDHPNICTVHEFDEAEEKSYISMAYIEGQSLKKKIESGPLKLVEALQIAAQVAEGLHEAHKKGVVHRDIKSSNIMVTDEGQAKIMDFGLARMTGGTLLTQEGMAMGTPAYMSPEQARGEEVDHRTDIWSFGVVLYEMLSGQLPFKGDRDPVVVYSILNERAEPITELNPEIPRSLEEVVAKALEKNQGDRYQQVEDLIDDLKSLSAGIVPDEIKVRLRKAKLRSRKRVFSYAGVAGFVIIIAVILLSLFTGRAEAIDSIAVLPFENTDPETEYLSDGITESLINKLSQLPSLKKVIARGSVFRYKGKEIDPQAVGQELEVKAVLMSQMIQRGDELSISVELMKVQDNSHIWGNKYNQKISEIIAVQEEISSSIVNSLQLNLTGEELKDLTKRYTENNEAYQLYLRGRYFWNKRTDKDLRRAISYYEKAIELDPSYALAYAGLADAYNISPGYTSIEGEEAYPKAKEMVTKALDMDESLAEAHTALGFLKIWYEWDWEAGEAALKRAVQLRPGHVTAHHWYAEYLSAMGRHEEAIAEAEKAYELDPFSPLINFVKAMAFFFARQYEKAVDQCLQALELNPDFTIAHSLLGWAYLENGMHEEAIAIYEKLKGEKSHHYIYYPYALPGRRDESLKMIEEMKKLGSKRLIGNAIDIAKIYAGLGEEEMALEWLEKSFDLHQAGMVRLKVDPSLDSLRSNPRFKVLLKKMKLE